ncbi:MAG TPA: hypothetical protein GXZ82_07520 [Firmicutes bacterium]|nr:hypothetical protein [Bacillota bacterium]
MGKPDRLYTKSRTSGGQTHHAGRGIKAIYVERTAKRSCPQSELQSDWSEEI